MTTLRDGSATSDRRLDRIPEIDVRSLDFPIRALVSASEPLPRSRTWTLRDRLDQGNEGACVGFAMAHHVAAAPIEQRAGTDAVFARERVYWRAQQIDEWEGGTYPGAPPPHDDGTSVLAGVKALAELGHVSEFRWAWTVADVARAIAQVAPVVLGIDWTEGMFDVDADGFVRATGEVAGGHAILARGVDFARARVTLTNSWGRGWGRNGDAWLSFADLGELLERGGEACVPIPRRA